MKYSAVAAGSAEATMLHLLSFLFSAAMFVGLALLIGRELRGSADRIVAALVRAPLPAAATSWPARVRLVSPPRPAAILPAVRPLYRIVFA